MQSASTEQANSQLVRLYYEEINKGNLAILDKLCVPGIIHHTTHSPKPVVGRPAVKKLLVSYHTAFPNLQYQLEHLICQGDLVAVNWKATGTFERMFRGILPTGKNCLMSGMTIYRVNNGKIEERWVVNDDLEILQQMGLARWVLSIGVVISVIFPFGYYKLKKLFRQVKSN